jgi:uncharacterized protein
MRPMSLYETRTSNASVSLRDLLDGRTASASDSGLGIGDIAEEIALGGWPGFRGLTTTRGLSAVRDYLSEIQRVDVERVDGRRRDPERVGRLMRSMARNVATHAAATALAADTGGADGPLKDDTVRDYLGVLERLMIVEDLPAWSPRMRSRTAVRSSPKRHFVDPSLAAAALDTSPDRLLRDLETLGFLFESLVVRDLRIYAQASDARVLQFRDAGGLEVDAIVEARSGAWMAFEVKLGQGQIDAAARTLTRFASKVDRGSGGAPATLGVITATGYAYERPDGVAVIPIGALGP